MEVKQGLHVGRENGPERKCPTPERIYTHHIVSLSSDDAGFKCHLCPLPAEVIQGAWIQRLDLSNRLKDQLHSPVVRKECSVLCRF